MSISASGNSSVLERRALGVRDDRQLDAEWWADGARAGLGLRGLHGGAADLAVHATMPPRRTDDPAEAVRAQEQHRLCERARWQ
jgi:hypothetical protein